MSETSDYESRLIDRDALRAYLEDKVGPADRYEVERTQAGHSNETIFITWDDREFVLRRPPAGQTADKAHEVLREYNVMNALQGSDVPVPKTILACEDTSVLGSEFYVMERLHGRIIRGEEPEEYGNPTTRRALSESFVDVLATIHTLDYEARGLGDFGKPEEFTERQVGIWTKQLRWATDYTGEEREVPRAFEVGEWLEENCPDSHQHSLVHGDYKMDNVMFTGEAQPDINGVFDWEMSTLGDPLTDLGWMLSFWHEASDADPVAPEFYPTYMAREGYLSRREMVDRYQEQTGIRVENLRFYVVLGIYKLTSIAEMFFARYLKDGADDPIYPKMRDRVPAMSRRALDLIQDERDPLPTS